VGGPLYFSGSSWVVLNLDMEPKENMALALSSGQSIWIQGRGWSMFPFIWSGDKVRIVPHGADYRQGEVVAFRSDGKIWMHRLIEWNASQDKWYAKGDNNLAYDRMIGTQQILGKISMIKRGHRLIAVPCNAWIAELSGSLGRFGMRLSRIFPLRICGLICSCLFLGRYLFRVLSRI